jgi:hypothetical protein
MKDEDFVSRNTPPLTMEAARYDLQLRLLRGFRTHLETGEQAMRQGSERMEAAASDLRRVLSGLQTIAGTSAEHVQITLRAVESLLAAIAEQNPAASISQAVIDNVYIELTPLLTSAVEGSAAKLTTEFGEANTRAAAQLLQIVQSVADAAAGKAPLPSPPETGASFLNKISRRLFRGLARVHRFCITVAPVLVTAAALLDVVVASSVFINQFVAHGPK